MAGFTTRLTRRAAALGCAVATALALSGGTPASAVDTGQAQPNIVSAVPSTATPNITDGIVRAITKVGSTIVAGGSFTKVQNQNSSSTLSRPDVLAFDAATGTVSTTFAPQLDGLVEAVAPGPTAGTVYVGGYFNTVNGVAEKSIALLDVATGARVPGFVPPPLNGAVYTISLTGGHLLLGGSFSKAGLATRAGLLSLDPATGALDSFLAVQLAGHHSYDGTPNTVSGALGARAMSVNPAGTRLIVLGNFKTADGLPRDQIVLVDLDGTTAQVDPNWATDEYTSGCHTKQYDTYVTDVQYSPDGTYFVVTATGGSGVNSDGTIALCDAAARFNAGDTGSDVQANWVDYTGGDTLLSVAITGVAVYVSGHNRWLNNEYAGNNAHEGAVPRPGLAALDPVSGIPLSWNPGRNPRGAGAYALYASDDGLYVGSDTDWFGDYKYLRRKIGFFPLAGGTAPVPTTTASLPANVYLAGPTSASPAAPTDLAYRYDSGTSIGATTVLPGTGIDWSTTRGAFVVGSRLFYGTADGTFHEAPFDGHTVGTPTVVDPYDDPAWDTVATGSGQTYRGVPSTYYTEIPSVTGAFYSAGRLYYTRANKPTLYWRWFSPDSGTVGTREFTISVSKLKTAAGMFVSGSTLYFASSTDGNLRSTSFVNGVPDATSFTVVSGPKVDGLNWAAHSLFLD